MQLRSWLIGCLLVSIALPGWAGGRICANITDEDTMQSLPIDGPVGFEVVEAGGGNESYSSPDGQRWCTPADALAPGTYFLATWNHLGYFDEIYDGFQMPYNIMDATPITVVEGGTTEVDIALEPGGGTISGNVTDALTGSPISDPMFIEVTDQFGNLIAGDYVPPFVAYTSSGGLRTGMYFVNTFQFDITYVNELYDDIPCPQECNPLSGTPVAVTEGVETTDINFALMPAAVFADDFETGDTSAWSSTVQ